MDSDRRHELGQNSLEKALRQAPTFFAVHGTKILLAVAAVALLLWVYNLRQRGTQQQAQAQAVAVSEMNELTQQALQLRQFGAFLDPPEFDRRRAQLASDFEAYAQLVSDARGPTAAHALRLRGDFSWAMGTLPEPAGDVSAPAGDGDLDGEVDDAIPPAPPRSQEEWLTNAETAFRRVVDAHSDQRRDVLASLFGLAAVAEERGDFDAARVAYEQARDHAGGDRPVVEVIDFRLAVLPTLAGGWTLPPPAPAAAPRPDLLGPDLDLDTLLRGTSEPDGPADSPADGPIPAIDFDALGTPAPAPATRPTDE